MKLPPQDETLIAALKELVARCPRLVAQCYWAGTSSVAIEELHHRQSFDLDFHTRTALQDTRPLLAELQAAFADQFSITQGPDFYGSGFQGALRLPGTEQIVLEVLSNYQDVGDRDLVAARSVRGILRVTLSRYLADKIQCLAERSEARDLVDVAAVLQHAPELTTEAKAFVARQDLLLLTERLLGWSDEAIEDDLAGYPDVDPGMARGCRDLLLGWLKAMPPQEENAP